MLRETLFGKRKGLAKEREDNIPLTFDPLKKYLSEGSQYGALSREEERKVAEKAHRFKDAGSTPAMLTRERFRLPANRHFILRKGLGFVQALSRGCEKWMAVKEW